MSEKISLQKNLARVNESLTKLYDESGVRRSFTVPYIDGQPMADHIAAVGAAAAQVGGLGKNLITSSHHSEGKGWGSGDGHTVGHPSDKLQRTVIRKDDEKAQTVIAAVQKFIDDVEKLLGEKDPAVLTANGQLALVKKTDGVGMTLFDFGVLMIHLLYPLMQSVSRAHDKTKPGGMHPRLRPPHEPEAAPNGQESPAEPQGGAQGGGEVSGASQAPAAAQAPPAAPIAAPPAAAPQAQG